MNDHLGILEKRIEAAAVGAERALDEPEGIGSEVYQQEKEDLDCGDDDRGVGEQALVGFVAKPEDEGVSGEQERPEKKRAFLSGPENREFVRTGKVMVTVMEQVGDGEIIAERGNDQSDGGEEDGTEDCDTGPASRVAEAVPAGVALIAQGYKANSKGVNAAGQSQE